MSELRAAITGIQGYLPPDLLTNEDLAKMVDTTDEWIVSRTGITQRHILKGEGLGTSHMAAEAGRQLLEKMGVDPLEIDLVLVATVTPDHLFPSTSNLVCDMIGAKNAFSFDLAAACSGFLYGMETARQFIENGRCKKVLLIGADKMSSIVDYTDRTTCILFGDGAGAVLLEPVAKDENVGIMDAILRSDGSGAPYLVHRAGGSRRPPSAETIANREHFLYQDGKTVFKYAVSAMADVTVELMERVGLKGDDIDWLVPHQANKRIIDATAQRAGVPDEKVMINIGHYGNTTAATIPLAMWDYESQLKKGQNLLLAAFGGGFTWGSLWLRWAYDPQ